MPKRAKPLYILLVEDDPRVRTEIGNAIAAEPLFQLMTVCASKCEAMRVIREQAPDIALVGLKLPDGSGLEVVEAMSRCQPTADVIVIGTAADKDVIFSAMEAGASGCLLKEALLRRREVHVSSIVIGLMLSRIKNNRECIAETARHAQVELTVLPQVQREILRCLVRGLSNKEIARNLVLTSYNVDYHLKCLRRRFSVHNRVQLVGAAMTLFAN